VPPKYGGEIVKENSGENVKARQSAVERFVEMLSSWRRRVPPCSWNKQSSKFPGNFL